VNGFVKISDLSNDHAVCQSFAAGSGMNYLYVGHYTLLCVCTEQLLNPSKHQLLLVMVREMSNP